MIRDQANHQGNLWPIQTTPEMHTALKKRNWVVSNSWDAGGANINRTSESAWNYGEMMETFPQTKTDDSHAHNTTKLLTQDKTVVRFIVILEEQFYQFPK